MQIEEIKKYIKEVMKGYIITAIVDYNNLYYVFLNKDKEYDIPVFVFSKTEEKMKLADRTSKEVFEAMQKGNEVYNTEDFDLDDEEGDYDV